MKGVMLVPLFRSKVFGLCAAAAALISLTGAGAHADTLAGGDSGSFRNILWGEDSVRNILWGEEDGNALNILWGEEDPGFQVLPIYDPVFGLLIISAGPSEQRSALPATSDAAPVLESPTF